MKYVGFWRRLLAYTLDMIPIFLLVFGIAYFFLGFDEVLSTYINSDRDFESRKEFLAKRNIVRDTALLLWIFYGFLMDCSRYQGTHGKSLLGIKVVDIHGNRITRSRSLSRMAMKIFGAAPLFLGYMWAGFRKDKAAWHDLAAKTRVIKR